MNQDRISKEAAAARDWLQGVCAGIVANQQELVLDVWETPNRIVISPTCAAGDGGRLIGRGGDMFRAIKFLARQYAKQNRLQQELEIGTIKAPRFDGPLNQFYYVGRWPLSQWNEIMGPFVEGVVGPVEMTTRVGRPVTVVYTVKKFHRFDELRIISEAMNTVGKALAKSLHGEVIVDMDLAR